MTLDEATNQGNQGTRMKLEQGLEIFQNLATENPSKIFRA